ncbi:band 7 protein [Alteromonas naphthalenivorans]|uniref:Band 7 protein n=1 Tax=Alteromonas naphthalenivorans TaxID=715451 RepID=F5ZCI7_ALTNA|nr:band 7 protein [Alteromonas naphthalenivorans]
METLQTSNLPSLLFIAGIIVVALITIGLIFAKLYTRATKETAFVRTGLGGEKVIKDGGAIVLPVVHEIIPVNMNTLRIEVEKTQKDALITKDRMRVDVKADFYLRVAPNSAGISMAAQTLGTRTTRAEEVKKTNGIEICRRTSCGCRRDDHDGNARTTCRFRTESTTERG